MEKGNNIFRIVVGVFALTLMVVGATYAWFTWKSSNVNISGTTGCFDIVYDKGQDIGSVDAPYSLMPTCNYNEGAYADVTMSIDTSCTTTGVASINLKSNNFTLYDGSDAFGRNNNVLKYQVVSVANPGTDSEVLTEIEGCNGYLTSTSNMSLCEVDLSYTPSTYRVYLYLDCNTVTTTYIGATYNGYIQTVATQIVE